MVGPPEWGEREGESSELEWGDVPQCATGCETQNKFLTLFVPQWPCLYNGVETMHILHTGSVRLKLVLNAQNTERHLEE